jgi:hypothetical protein
MPDKLAAFADQVTYHGPPVYLSSGNTLWAQRYATELRDVVMRYAARLPRNVQRHLGPSELGHACLSGDTEVVTREGLKPIRDLAKTGEAELLVPMLYAGSDVRKRWGKFRRVPVTCFGEQELLKVTLTRSGSEKVIYATPEHTWFRSYWSGKQKKQQRLTTRELRPGQRLTQLRRAMPRSATLMDVAAAQGFVFGDGSRLGNRQGSNRVQAGVLSIYANGKDSAMLKFFPASAVREVKSRADEPDRGVQLSHEIRPLPKFWKELPPIGESSAFLVSWLAGYFAADGTVSEDDGHCSISSASRENLEFVRSVAAVCGIGYGLITTSMRVGISGKTLATEATPLHKLTLRRADLPLWFFLTEEHRRRAEAASQNGERDLHWKVASVERTGRRELVYCATVEGTGAFGLADDLMTGNCDRQVVGKMAGVSFGESTGAIKDTYAWASVVGTAIHAFLEQAFAWDAAQGGNPGRWFTERRVCPDPGADQPHPGTADLYDTLWFAVDDHKGQSEAIRTRLRRDGPPLHYFLQLLFYAIGYMNEGFDVRRMVLISWPRTKSTLDDMYVWEHEITNDDLRLALEYLDKTRAREDLAKLMAQGRVTFWEVPMTPSDDDCQWCPFWNAAASTEGTKAGCPGTSLKRDLR